MKNTFSKHIYFYFKSFMDAPCRHKLLNLIKNRYLASIDSVFEHRIKGKNKFKLFI